MKYKAVLFDLDGTLLDTLKDIADSVNLALDRLGFPQHEINAYKYFVGDGREALAIRVLPEDHRDTITFDRLVLYIKEEYSKHWSNNTRPYRGIPEMLQAVTDLGIKMAILSNKPQNSTEEMVYRLLPKWHFELIVGALPTVAKKPDSAAALRIAEQLEITPTAF
ncbi:HAD family hydrolase [Chloroflexota bacterium]